MSTRKPRAKSPKKTAKDNRDLLEEAGDNLVDAISDMGKAMNNRDTDVVSGLRSLVDGFRHINSIVDLTPLLISVVDHTLRMSGTERGFIMLYEPVGRLTFVMGRTKDGADLPEQDFRISMSTAEHVAATGEAVYATGPGALRVLKQKRSARVLELNTIVCVPLQTDSGIQGVLYADSRSLVRDLDNVRTEMVNAFADQAAAAIANLKRLNSMRDSKAKLEIEADRLRKYEIKHHGLASIIGGSPPMLELFGTMEKVAQSSAAVLIDGETGTGKEMVAKTIHYLSSRQNGPFVAVNCGGIVETLLESELFGYRRGAFTGAIEDKPGRFEAAHKGTIFLDEVSSMSPGLQVKLLRALQEGEVVRVGENDPRRVDARVISATNENLEEAIKSGGFRADLFYRLNVIQLKLPPLRERGDDILLLAEHFLEKYSRKGERGPLRLTPEAANALMAFNWPGNVRELENVIERAVAFGAGTDALTLDLLPKQIAEAAPDALSAVGRSYKDHMDALERQMLTGLLAANGWNVARVAAAKKTSKQNVYNRMKKLGIALPKETKEREKE